MLLNAVLGEQEISSELIRELRPIGAMDRLSSRRIFHVVFALDAAGTPLTFDEVNARLEETDRNLLAEAVLREDVEVSREEALAAVESIRRSQAQNQRVELKARIKESERGGRWEEALHLMEELQQLERTSRERR